MLIMKLVGLIESGNKINFMRYIMDNLQRMLCQRIGIFYRDNKWAEKMFNKIIILGKIDYEPFTQPIGAEMWFGRVDCV